ncbi:medium-chain fatty acid-CoA ligase faa2 [Coemansia javaensis]|uniref:Medium-chain fatty acid-CoA ligase faa2 n=1 Tax=Coemansia javaensis TaxID=2761396 RepID=A0A9W8H3W6_9FUNG|nr:medium-chain fatty acid-CoA ligase faa2 [Coemansia javaensis]
MSQRKGSAPPCAIECPGTEAAPGETRPFVNHNSTGKLISHTPGLNSLYDTFLHGRGLAGKHAPAFGYRPADSATGGASPYRWVTWDAFHERFVCLASGLRHLGAGPGDRIGIMLSNSVEWMLAEYAAIYQGFISVPLYESLPRDSLALIIRETEMRVAVCLSEHAHALLDMAESIPTLRTLVVVGAMQPDLLQLAKACNVRVQALSSAEGVGRELPVESPKLPVADDVATIIYTSGTSGQPKGVVVTHANFLATIASFLALRDSGDMYSFSSSDCSMAFLPLAHCLGRFVTHLIIAFGGRTAFPRGDPTKLVEDLHDLQPTLFVGVPRLFSRIQERVLATVKLKGGLPAALFHYAYNTKKNNLRRGLVGHWLWDRVVFKPLREKFGGRLNLIVSGSAAISPETLEFLRCCFSCCVVEGYGLTESLGPTTVTLIDDIEPGNVGAPIPSAMMKLRDVPELGYAASDVPHPRGEILIKGPHISSGYYLRPEATREAFTADGWLCTGDIGSIDERGRFHIIDRRNNMFKMAQGEFIAPERIENVLTSHLVVNQAFVHGDPLRSSLVAIIVPNESMFAVFLQSRGVISAHPGKPPSLEDMCRSARAREEVLAELVVWAEVHDLRRFEIPRRICLVPTPFEGLGLLTPTMKLKRRDAQAHFGDLLTKLYTDNP